MRLVWVVQVPAASLLHYLIGRLSRLLLLSTQVRISDRHLIGWITLVDVEILPAAVFATRPLVPIPHALDLHEDRIAHAFGARVKTGWDKEGVELAAFGVVLAVEQASVGEVPAALGFGKEGLGGTGGAAFTRGFHPQTFVAVRFWTSHGVAFFFAVLAEAHGAGIAA